MENLKESLIKDQKEFKKGLAKLTDYINSEKFYALSTNHRQLLKNKKMAMELYLNVLNMQVFEDIDNAYVPDYGFLQAMINAFGGNVFNSQKSNATTETEFAKMLKNNKQES